MFFSERSGVYTRPRRVCNRPATASPLERDTKLCRASTSAAVHESAAHCHDLRQRKQLIHRWHERLSFTLNSHRLSVIPCTFFVLGVDPISTLHQRPYKALKALRRPMPTPFFVRRALRPLASPPQTTLPAGPGAPSAPHPAPPLFRARSTTATAIGFTYVAWLFFARFLCREKTCIAVFLCLWISAASPAFSGKGSGKT